MKSDLLRTLQRNDGVKLKIQTKLQVGIVVLAVVCFYVIILTSRILQLGSVASVHSVGQIIPKSPAPQKKLV